MATFALIAIFFDPSQPASRAPLAYTLLLAYFVYASAIVVVRPSSDSIHWPIIFHIVDITAFAFIMQLTEGPTSPFFVLFTFALLSAALQWNFRGAIFTTAALIGLMGILAIGAPTLIGDDAEVDRFIMRGSYLVVAGCMLAYFGAYRERDRQRLTTLAAWPQDKYTTDIEASLRGSLSYALGILNAQRVLLVWEDADEPFWYCSYWDGENFRMNTVPWSEFGMMGVNQSTTVEGRVAQAETRMHHTGTSEHSLPTAVVQKFDITDFISASFKNETHNGHLLILEPKTVSPGSLALAEIVASHIAAQLENHALGVRIAEAASAGERERIARDIHDGLLQDLTAAQLWLRKVSNGSDSVSSDGLSAIQSILLRQQRRVRNFVDETPRKTGATTQLLLQEQVDSFIKDLSIQWGITIQLQASLADQTASEDFFAELCLILAEAVANAVRHGGATEANVELSATDRQVLCRIKDNGSGFKGIVGAYEHGDLFDRSLGPKTIVQRVHSLGGQVRLATSSSGVQLDLQLPLT